MCQCFSHFPVFLHHFVLAKLATSSIRVNVTFDIGWTYNSSNRVQHYSNKYLSKHIIKFYSHRMMGKLLSRNYVSHQFSHLCKYFYSLNIMNVKTKPMTIHYNSVDREQYICIYFSQRHDNDILTRNCINEINNIQN